MAQVVEKHTTIHMSYSLNSLKGGYIGDYIEDYYRVIKGDTKSLDYSSYVNAQIRVVHLEPCIRMCRLGYNPRGSSFHVLFHYP